jgi:hypothetical protein
VVIMLAIALNPNTFTMRTYAGMACSASALMAVEAYYLNRITRFTPNTLEAEAIAWLLQSSPSQKSSWFMNSGRVANTDQRKALLLNTLILLLPPLVASRLQHLEGTVGHNELRTYLSCLAHLSNFCDSKQSFLRNNAAIEHPPLPRALLGQLEALRRSPDEHLRETAEVIWSHFGVGSGNDDKNEKELGVV